MTFEDPFQNAHHRGNTNLKGSNTTAYISEDEFKHYTTEIVKCSKDPIYFADNYYTIVSLDQGKHVIDTYESQKRLVKFIAENNRVVTLASRQCGKTTAYSIFGLWLCCFQEDKRILIVANKLKTAKGIMARIRLAYELLPKWLKPGIVTWNKTEIEFSNGSGISACSTSSSAGRSESINCLILDEFAFVPQNIQEELWTSVYPVISSSKDSKIVIVSTPNGTGEKFHELYQSAELGTSKSGWKHYRIDWWDVPGRDEEWKEITLASLNFDDVKFSQEFGNQFLGSTYTLITGEVLIEHKKHILKMGDNNVQPKIIKIDDYDVEIWKPPADGRCYVMGCDVADGVGFDSSVAMVFDITDIRNISHVATFASSKISTFEYPYLITKLGYLYNNAAICLEVNSIGKSVADALHYVYNYENIVSPEYKHTGMWTSTKTKLAMCLTFKKFLEHPMYNCTFNDKHLIEQLECFEKHTGGSSPVPTYRASKGKHDDHVMAAMLAFYIFGSNMLEYFFTVRTEHINFQDVPVACRQMHTNLMSDYKKAAALNEIDRIYEDMRRKSTGDITAEINAGRSSINSNMLVRDHNLYNNELFLN